MNIESIILELMSRVQALESEVKGLKEIINTKGEDDFSLQSEIKPDLSRVSDDQFVSKTDQILAVIEEIKNNARDNGEKFVILSARMVESQCKGLTSIPIIVNSMRKAMKAGDIVTNTTGSGCSPYFTIKYYLNNKEEQRTTKGRDNNFIIKYGKLPYDKRFGDVGKIYQEGFTPLVYDSTDNLVGVCWKHFENRPAAANGQAEICFFDNYNNAYGHWHRCKNQLGGRLMFCELQEMLAENGEVSYVGYIRS